MTVTIVERTRTVTGGVDTHLEQHVAAALDDVGWLLGTASFPANTSGYRALFEWLATFGRISAVGVEGTGAYGAGLARSLRARDVLVFEVDRPNRQARRAHGKSDTLDAIEAARTVLAGKAGIPRRRDGEVEAMRTLLVARRSAAQSRTKAIVQMRHLSFTAPEMLRERLKGRSIPVFVTIAASLRPAHGGDVVVNTTKFALRSLALRVRTLEAEIVSIDARLKPLVTEVAPELLSLIGVGPITTAMLLVAAGDNPERLRSEGAFAHLCGVAPIPASSGKITRHRLDRGGDRQANSALPDRDRADDL
jgi:transposase